LILLATFQFFFVFWSTHLEIRKDYTIPDLEPLSPPHKKQWTTWSSNVDDEVENEEWGIALPDPGFICIHLAIAGVLHMSGAGEEIDTAIKRSGGAGLSGLVQVGDEFDHLCLQESLGGLFMKQVSVN
jgi:hypothetical protein